MKKFVSTIVCVLLLSSIFVSACSNEMASPSSNQVTLRFATWDTGESLKYEQEIAKLFEQKNPHVKVQVESYAEGYDDKIAASFGTKNPPDVMYMWNYPTYYQSLLPMDDLLAKDTAAKSITEDFYENIFNYHKFEGSSYGLPVGFVTRVIYYNKKLFDEAGLPYPTEGWTWDDFRSAAKQLSNPAKKQYGFVLKQKDNSYAFQEFVWSNGGNFISPDGKKLEGFMNSQETKEAISIFSELIKDGSAIVVERDRYTESFKSGKIAMIENGIWPLEGFKEAGLDFGTVELPAFPGKPVKGVIHSAGVSIAKDTKQLELAWEFVKFFVSTEGAKIRKGDMPALKSVAKETKVAEDPLRKPFYSMLEKGDEVPAFLLHAKWNEIDKNLDYAISSVLLGKDQAGDALDKAVKVSNQFVETK
ncbi:MULTISPECIES: sugar ABC transporter substrate-binding protein [unclassified Brevibacillus]|uniref:ABC transporter substrate-binding protein n=1 Tax=unclassified Brevibacillus TaxID=2684853 RepID=UPI003565774B